MKFFIIMSILILGSVLSLAAEFGFSSNFTTRFRDEPGRNRTQKRIVFKFVVTLDNEVELIAIGSNGTSFNSRYDTFYDSSREDRIDGGDNVIKNFAPRNFYFQKTFDSKLVIQGGALPIEKGLTSITALDSGGWVDGARLKATTPYGKLRISAGSLSDPTEINAFERDRDLNYFEISLKKEFIDNVLVELGYEFHDDDNFLTLAYQQKLALASDKIITVVAEALVNVDEGAIKASVGIKGNFIDLLTNRKSGITFELRTNFNDEDIGSRGTILNSGFKTSEGHYGTISAKFNINKKKGISGYCRYRKSDNERFECGVTKKIK